MLVHFDIGVMIFTLFSLIFTVMLNASLSERSGGQEVMHLCIKGIVSSLRSEPKFEGQVRQSQ